MTWGFQWLFIYNPKSTTDDRKKLISWTSLKFKTFIQQKKTIQRMKNKLRFEVFVKHISDKGFVSKNTQSTHNSTINYKQF